MKQEAKVICLFKLTGHSELSVSIPHIIPTFVTNRIIHPSVDSGLSSRQAVPNRKPLPRLAQASCSFSPPLDSTTPRVRLPPTSLPRLPKLSIPTLYLSLHPLTYEMGDVQGLACGVHKRSACLNGACFTSVAACLFPSCDQRWTCGF
jgi:hypothetical protein